MNIKELESQTGVTRQNIRFYEKKGLLHPKRNTDNNYREYTLEDVETLNLVKVLRKLDVPIEDIRSILEKEASMDAVIRRHLDVLLQKRSSLNAAIKMCRIMLETDTECPDSTSLLNVMDDLEKKGGHFMNILEDYKKTAAIEKKRTFSFAASTMVLTPREFTDALLQYAKESGRNLTITKEGMYPLFEIDGIEYRARRSFYRFDAVIHCTATHSLMGENEIPRTRRTLFRVFRFFLPPFGILGIFYLLLPALLGIALTPARVISFLIILIPLLTICGVYQHLN